MCIKRKTPFNIDNVCQTVQSDKVVHDRKHGKNNITKQKSSRTFQAFCKIQNTFPSNNIQNSFNREGEKRRCAYVSKNKKYYITLTNH